MNRMRHAMIRESRQNGPSRLAWLIGKSRDLVNVLRPKAS